MVGKMFYPTPNRGFPNGVVSHVEKNTHFRGVKYKIRGLKSEKKSLEFYLESKGYICHILMTIMHVHIYIVFNCLAIAQTNVSMNILNNNNKVSQST